MSSSEIVIRIDHTVQDDSVQDDTVQDAGANKALTKDKSNDRTASKAIAAYLGKQALSYAVSNYGNLTGDYIAQANMQGTIEIAGMIAMAVSSPVGAITATVGLAIRVANNSIENYKKSLATEQLRLRTGMMSYSGGRS
jgi:hypothetical protein